MKTQLPEKLLDDARHAFRAQVFAHLIMTAHRNKVSDDLMARRLGLTTKTFQKRFYSPEKYRISDLGEFAAAMGCIVNFDVVPKPSKEEG